MITPEEALSLISSNVGSLPARTVSLSDAEGCVLAASLTARLDLPSFDNSAMDGYAVRASDLAGASRETPVSLRLCGEAPAGSRSSLSVAPGVAVRILTGAPVPVGADAVVMQEKTEREGEYVRFFAAPSVGANIRPRGEDVKAQAPLLAAGCTLRPYEIGLLASQGIAEVEVIPRPTAAVLATGSELAAPGVPLGPGQIYNSNGPALGAALRRWGVAVRDLGSAPDAPSAIARALRPAVGACDLLLVAGGVSVGDYDYTRSVLREFGFEEVFYKVATKPGKPLLFGRIQAPEGGRTTWVFGLPGNPLSALVSLEEFVRPAIERMQGMTLVQPSYHLRGRALNAYPLPKDRQQFLFCRARPDGDGFALEVIRPQGSAMSKMATGANALAVARLGMGVVREGDFLPFRWLK
jgi:molybdopterin molybdotransferase